MSAQNRLPCPVRHAHGPQTLPSSLLTAPFNAPLSAPTVTALLRAAILLTSAVAMTGCGGRTSTSTASGNEEPASAQVSQKAAHREKLLETWDVIYLRGSKIGSIHSVFEAVERDGEPLIRATSLQALEIPRDGQLARMETRIEAWESSKGTLHSFTLEQVLGQTPIVTRGTYRDEELHLATDSEGKQLRSTMPWDDNCRGFFALDQSLRDQPMKPGERRELSQLMPGIVGVQMITTSLQAEAIESVDLLDGPRELLRIVMQATIAGQQFDSIGWTAPDGELLKLSFPGLGQISYRTTKARATAASTGDFDLFRDTIVKIAPPLPHPHQLTRAEYQVTLAAKDPSQVFVSGGSQLVHRVNSRQARLTVVAVRPDTPVGTAEPPDPSSLAASNLIQSDDANVKKLAEQLCGTASDPWAQCLALEKGVHRVIQTKNFSHGFATAAEVARTLEGDCTEHSLLLTALCRARKIPARAVLGLVYTSRNQGFAFHMWTEAWVSDRWIPLDATLGQGGIGAAHLKLNHSTMAREGAETAVLSVVQVINQMEVNVLGYEPARL